MAQGHQLRIAGERHAAPLQWRVRSTRVHGNLPLRHKTSRTPSPTTHGRQPWQILRFPLAPCLSILSDTNQIQKSDRLIWVSRSGFYGNTA